MPLFAEILTSPSQYVFIKITQESKANSDRKRSAQLPSCPLIHRKEPLFLYLLKFGSTQSEGHFHCLYDVFANSISVSVIL